MDQSTGVGQASSLSQKDSQDGCPTKKPARGRVEVVQALFDWSDMGSWSAVAAQLPVDADGNAVEHTERFLGEDVEGCVILGNADKLICGLGLRDLVVVDTDDALFLCARGRDQEVRRIVEQLKERRMQEWL